MYWKARKPEENKCVLFSYLYFQIQINVYLKILWWVHYGEFAAGRKSHFQKPVSACCVLDPSALPVSLYISKSSQFIPWTFQTKHEVFPQCSPSQICTCPHWCKSSYCFSTQMTFIMRIIAIPWIVAVPYTVYRPPGSLSPFILTGNNVEVYRPLLAQCK